MSKFLGIVVLSLILYGCSSDGPRKGGDNSEQLPKISSLTDEELLNLSIEKFNEDNYDDALTLVNAGLDRENENRVNYLHLRYGIYQIKKNDQVLVEAAIDLAHHYTNSPKKSRDVSHIFLRLNEPDSALSWLETTFKRGFQDYSDLDQNPVYDPIRGTIQFANILNEVKIKMGLNMPAKPILGESLDGAQIDLSDYRGKVILIDFWALYCSPCLKEIDEFLGFYPELSEQSFEILAINLDQDLEEVEKYVADKKMTWPIIYSGSGWEDDNRVAYDLKNIPSYWLVDKEGILRSIGLNGPDLENAIRSLL